ncbi:MAG: hypothetical protein K2K06_03405 [Oscillospiraceae bacterium]|nr:hypothetical protein [Oscillospiraceae bacterium]
MKNKKYIKKKTFKRLKQENYKLSEAEQVIINLEIAKEAGDDLWKELMLTVLEDMELMKSEAYQCTKQNIIRRMNDEL